MKKLLLFSLLTFVTLNVVATEPSRPTKETDVLSAIGRYVISNPIKCSVATILAVDFVIHGYPKSIVKKASEFAKDAAQQTLADGKVVQGAVEGLVASLKTKLS